METYDIVGTLAATPGRLRERLEGVDEAARSRQTAPGDWSALDVFRHMRASSAILTPRFAQVVVRPGAPLPAFDERRWGELLERAALPLERQLDAFESARVELVALLGSFSPDEWALTGAHEEHGAVSLQRLAEHFAGHEQEHLAQLDALIGRSPTDRV